MRRKRAMLLASWGSRKGRILIVSRDEIVTPGTRYAWKVFNSWTDLEEYDPLRERLQEAIEFRDGMPIRILVRSRLEPGGPGWRLK